MQPLKTNWWKFEYLLNKGVSLQENYKKKPTTEFKKGQVCIMSTRKQLALVLFFHE